MHYIFLGIVRVSIEMYKMQDVKSMVMLTKLRLYYFIDAQFLC
jgi:hypothetical protein